MLTMRRCLLSLAIFALLWLMPAAGQACPKCFASSDQQVLQAYYISIMFMILIPFGIVGSVLAWLHRRYRQTPRLMPAPGLDDFPSG